MKEFAGFKVMKGLMKIFVPIFDSKQDNIRGSKGQMVGFDDDGKPIATLIPDTGVISFNGRGGNVFPASGDYTPQMVGADPAGSAQTVKEELTEAIGVQVNILTQKIKDEVDPHINDKNNPHNVTAEQLGLGNVENVSVNDQAPTYTISDTLTNIISGETISISLGKIQKAIDDLIAHISNKNNPHDVTKSQVGLGNVPNVATDDQTPTYTAATTLATLTSGEKLSISMGKIKKAISDLINHLANTSNPHGVSITQIGAAPASHSHNASDLNINPLLYGDTDGVAGKFDNLTTAPTATTALRYNGVFRATKVFGIYFSDSADVAEIYPVEGIAEPGDLIAINPDGSFSANKIDSNPCILGVISESPGFTLGEGTEGVPIALCGRVPVKVEGSVQAGDFLIGSASTGICKKADMNNPPPRGSIIGIALETKNTDEVERVITFIQRM